MKQEKASWRRKKDPEGLQQKFNIEIVAPRQAVDAHALPHSTTVALPRPSYRSRWDWGLVVDDPSVTAAAWGHRKEILLEERSEDAGAVGDETVWDHGQQLQQQESRQTARPLHRAVNADFFLPCQTLHREEAASCNTPPPPTPAVVYAEDGEDSSLLTLWLRSQSEWVSLSAPSSQQGEQHWGCSWLPLLHSIDVVVAGPARSLRKWTKSALPEPCRCARPPSSELPSILL